MRYPLSGKFILVLACCLLAGVPACAPKPSPTPTRAPTRAPTRTPVPSRTPTLTLTPTPTITPTITNTPTVTRTKGVCSKAGQAFRLTGYLSILQGQYSSKATAYTIAFYDEDSSKARTIAKVHAGNQPNSMYFVDKKPKIKDRYGAVLDWTIRDGVTVYRTQKVIISGTYYTDYDELPDETRVNCYLDVDTIQKASGR